MTLVLTEISQYGIAMAADSAVTYGTDVKRSLTGVQKLLPIKKIKAGISCWGEGKIDDTDTDIWLYDFIGSNKRQYNSIDEFAILLRDELRRYIGQINPRRNDSRWGTIGFHLAGFVDYNGKQVPSFYHIHNGRSQILESRGIRINSRIVNANHDMPPSRINSILSHGGRYITRNGDIYIYATILEMLQGFFNRLKRETPIRIPYATNIEDRVEWLKYQINIISGLYEISNIGPTIGGNISTLAITEQGIKNYRLVNPYFRD
jgi:hypothetical protein